ncbi:hypothetical protein BGZ65_000421 [Modicella reniformis]|uniref:Galactose oxidase n=1 Tax=Modicella reniformis TaxID=1440133 RepID=A0A9P6MAA4_9FUNG|nr:hypothetical protein BGZ65_000421 [Modicella reniformis]
MPLVLACSIAVLSSIYAQQPHPTGGAAFVSFHDRLYVQGGDLGGGNLVNQFYALDLSRGWQTSRPVWAALPSGPINAYHSGGFSAEMNSFVTFGREAGSPYTTANFINIFSTSTGSWIGTGSTMITDPTRRDMVIASDPAPGGQIYVIGGDAGQSGAGRSNVLDIYNLKSSVVSETNVPLPGPQYLQGGGATWLSNRNSMLIVGGLFDNFEVNTVYMYTPGSGSSGSNTNYDEDGSQVAVFGGFVNRSSTSDHSVYFLDTRTWSWTVSTYNSVRGRSYSACAFSENQFIVWGGFYQNPTSTPNNLPSVEESTMVYSLDSQSWVSTFVPSVSSPESSSNSHSGSSGSRNNNSNNSNNSNDNSDLSDPKGKSVGLVLAIAAAGAILALVITGGAIFVIRKRNRRRRNNSNGTRPSTSQNGVAPMPTSNPYHSKKWDQKSLTGLEAGNMMPSSGNGELVMTGDSHPHSSYTNWENRGSISSHREDDMGTTTTTTTNPMMGITQTTIVATPKNGSKSAGKSYTGAGRRGSDQYLERPSFSHSVTTFTKDSWSESQQNLGNQQQNLEQEFEEKSQGTFYPISVEREYR